MKYEKWSFGYWLLKQYVIFADWLIHKKTIITGKEKIPVNKPVVFAPNHQNALSDPLAILLHTRFQPVWLSRADIFKSKFASTILRFMKMMPVYRIRDGKENLEKNDQTFSNSIKVLENNSALALFPEAAHSGKRQMLSHKKAVPRIVLMAEEKTKFTLDIHIIPTGIYYSHYWKFDRTVIVNFGDPIRVKDFEKLHTDNPNAAFISLKEKIHESVLPLIIDFRSKKYYNEFEIIREVYGKYFLKRKEKNLTAIHFLKSDQLLANRLDELENEKPQETEMLISKVKSYTNKLNQLKLRSWLVDKNQNNFLKTLANILVLLLGLPVFIYGFIFNAIPFFLIDRFIRSKVKDIAFWSSFFLVAGIILFPIFYCIYLVAGGWLLHGFWIKSAFVVSLPFAGKLAFKWYILLRKTIGRVRFLLLKLFNKNEYYKLIEQKNDLFSTLDKLIPV